jgi:hypothetical protein
MAHPHASPTLAYAPRDPEQTLLHQVVREHLPSFLAHSDASDRPLPRFVTRELENFLRCGVLRHGFLRLRCDDCRAEHALPFSCKRRGVCSSCAGRRMADTAAHLVDRVLPYAPTRQWVLSFPFPLRYRLAYDNELCSAVLALFLRSVFASLRRRARRELSIPFRHLHCGAVSVLQRFGDGLRLNLHIHSIVLDGVYVRDPAAPHAAPAFHPLPPPDDAEVARIAQYLARRLKAFLLHRALLAEDDEHLEHDPLTETDPALATLYGASVRGRVALGPRAGQRLRRIGDQIDADHIEWGASPRCASAGGLNLHANVAVHAKDRSRLERLARYILRPAVAADRLSQLPDDRLLYRLKHSWRDGTQALLFEPLDFLGKLAALIPPARAHQIRYHGVFAARSSLRDLVTADRPDLNTAAAPPAFPVRSDTPGPHRPRHLRWAELLRRVFHFDLERCPRCGGRLRMLAAIVDPRIAQAILACLSLSRAPPLESHTLTQTPV